MKPNKIYSSIFLFFVASFLVNCGSKSSGSSQAPSVNPGPAGSEQQEENESQMNYLIQLGMSPEQIERYLSQGYTLEEIIKGVLIGEIPLSSSTEETGLSNGAGGETNQLSDVGVVKEGIRMTYSPYKRGYADGEKVRVTFEFTDQVIPTGEHLKIFGGVGVSRAVSPESGPLSVDVLAPYQNAAYICPSPQSSVQQCRYLFTIKLVVIAE